jgi:hypothetical protein
VHGLGLGSGLGLGKGKNTKDLRLRGITPFLLGKNKFLYKIGPKFVHYLLKEQPSRDHSENREKDHF